jgi:hypothetical protein
MWKTDPNDKRYVADPIYTFQFSILYDKSALEPVGIETSHPIFDPNDPRFLNHPDPLAKNFDLNWDVHPNNLYRTYVYPDTSQTTQQDRDKGNELVIEGVSTEPLPNTTEEFQTLLYVRFRVVATEGFVGNARKTIMYINPELIKYNELNISTTAPFIRYRNFPGYEDILQYYPDPVPYDPVTGLSTFTGIAGINNRPPNPNNPPPNSLWGSEPTLPGVIYVNITDNIPQFRISLNRAIGSSPALNELIPGTLWDMVDPITTDSAGIDIFYPTTLGNRKIKLENFVPRSRLLDIEVETDQPWLGVNSDLTSGQPYTNIKRTGNFKQSGYIRWLDNGILGTEFDPMGTLTNLANAPAEFFLNIKCDKDLIAPNAGEMCGVYIGYVTVKSTYAKINPVRLRVTYINFRSAFEPELYNIGGVHRGINLLVRNSRGALGDTALLVFGVGYRATDGVDSLFGEYMHNTYMTGFDARWLPYNKATGMFDVTSPGYGDFVPNDEVRYVYTKRSRDIRSNFDTTSSISYKCEFNADGANNYPIIIEWNVNDFPPDAQLFIRDTLNGAAFTVDMRRATPMGNNRYSYAIVDPAFSSFIIEYTLPKIINYVDEFGNPIIKKGWNLLSLPVYPTDPTWNVFYPNAINRPFYFSQNQYQDSQTLTPGIGYFIKYSDKVDTRFAGSYINYIKWLENPSANDVPPRNFEARLYPGWNTIGGLSIPFSISDINFTTVSGLAPAVPQYTLSHGVWAYRTDKGYDEVSQIFPGLGYWIKVGNASQPGETGHGYLFVMPTLGKSIGNYAYDLKDEIYNSSNKLVVRDNAQHEGNVYLTGNSNIKLDNFEMPPAPPMDLFDLRFATNRNLENANSTILLMQGITFPASISMDRSDAKYTFTDAVTGALIGTINKDQAGNVNIPEGIKAVRINKLDTGTLELSISNYPNPVETVSTVQFNMVQNGNATVTLYDALGNQVSTLFDGNASTGTNSVQLNAAALPTGSYICRIAAGNQTAFTTITIVK